MAEFEDKKISELERLTGDLTPQSLFETAYTDSQMEEGEYAARAVDVEQIGRTILNDVEYATELETNDKTIFGAINELAKGGGGGGGSNVTMEDNPDGGVNITVESETRTLATQENLMDGVQLPNYTKGMYLDDNGTIHEDERYILSDFIEVTGGSSISWYHGQNIPSRIDLIEYTEAKVVNDYWPQANSGVVRTFNCKTNTKYIRASFYTGNLPNGFDYITMGGSQIYKVGYREGGLLGLNDLNEKVGNMLKHIQVELCNNLEINANANSPQIQLSSLLPSGFDMDKIVSVSTECTYTTGSWRCICNPMKVDNEYYFIIASVYGATSTVTFKANVYYI